MSTEQEFVDLRVTPVDEEYMYVGDVIISQTDLKGNIVYANRMFCDTSGYRVSELTGKPHNIIRHPDMPKATFEKMWETIQSGQSWNGLIKNLRKDGLYYWVETEISSVRNEHHETVGYIAARKPVSRANIEEVEQQYRKLIESEG